MWKIDLNYSEEFQTTFDRLNGKKQILQSSRPLPNIALNKIKESLSIKWTYNSNSIEGNSLTLRETQMVIQEGITIQGKSLREHFETYNDDKAIDFLFKVVNDEYVLKSINILSLHALVLRSIEEDFAGHLRNAGARITGANFVPPNANKVSDLLDE
ncbi:huntingtin interacting protein E-like protein [Flavobacterium frigoris PS1]|uniref:Huntingtin interacting protein E-like protein n=1 Tax=Flavobacterium frigoris (strain PS1) TaxID=1086011 RepID=H7FWA4_FLAFP|nr:hypothetical protein [Flavobacterium frigoris]EIA07179.1 huntingtin interacting protein E-like protein [Flavobacterium frigoris PS1]